GGLAACSRDGLGGRGRRVAVGVEDSNVCSLPRIAQRDRPADAGPAAGDHRNVLLEKPGHFPFPSLSRVPGNLTIQGVPLRRNLLQGVSPGVAFSRIGARQGRPRRELRGLQEAHGAPTIVPSQCRRSEGAEGLAPLRAVTANMGGMPDVETAVEAGGFRPIRLDPYTRAYRGECPRARALEDAERVR